MPRCGSPESRISDRSGAGAGGRRRLLDQAKAEGVSLTGPGGLLGGLTKRVPETALEGELRRVRQLTQAPPRRDDDDLLGGVQLAAASATSRHRVRKLGQVDVE